MVSAAVSDVIYRCSECIARADFEAQGRYVETVFTRIDGVEKVAERYRRFYLCSQHATEAARSDDPPRSLEALPRFSAEQAKARSAQRASERGALDDAQLSFGTDWGRSH